MLVVLLLCCCCVALGAQTLTTTSEPVSATSMIRALADGFWVENAEVAHLPGLVLVVVEDGQVLFADGYGFADLDRGVPMTPKTGLRAGSVSKPVTATAVMQLVEQGAMGLDIPVSDYITRLELDDGFGRASTVAELLTHRGGYDDTVVGSHAPTLDEWQPLEQYLAASLGPRAMAPGKVMSYSSWGHALLGYALQEVTGLPYADAIADNLLLPLGMSGSTFAQPLPAHLASNLATGYGYAAGEYHPVPHDFVRLSPGVALVTNGEDMGRFMRALLSGGKLGPTRILEPATVDLLLHRQVAAHAHSRGRTYGFSELTLSGRQVIYHDGNGIGFSNRLILVPDHDLGIFVSANHRSLSHGASSTAASDALKGLATQVLESLVPEDPVDVPAARPLPYAAQRAARYEGQYRLASTARHDFFRLAGLGDHVDVEDNRDGSLRIGSNRWIEVEPLVFQHPEATSAFVVFVEDDRGAVEFLTFGGTASYRRLAWYETTTIHLGLTVGMLLLFLSMAVVWPKRRHGHGIAWLVSVLNLAFFTAFGLTMIRADFLLFFKSVPLGLRLIMSLPWLSALLTVGLLAFAWRTWRSTRLHFVWKAHYVAVTLASVAFVWYVSYWNVMAGA